MKIALAMPVLVVLLSFASAEPAAAAPNDGMVTGQLVNRTAGGGQPTGASVTLVAFGRKEQAPVGQQSTQTDARGMYSFSGLDRDPNLVYLTLARYQDVNYPTDQPFQLQDQSTYQADIAVYESTNADDVIQLEGLNLLVMGGDQGMLQLMEMGALVNTSDRTFVTANPQDQALARGIKFALPSGALQVQMQTGFNDRDVTSDVAGVQVTSPVPPGRHQFALSFQLPYTGSSADISVQLPYPTSAFNVYLPDTGVKLDRSALAASGATQMGGQSYAVYSASNVAKSTMMGGQLTGLGATGAVGPNQLALVSLGVVALVLGGGVVMFGMRHRRGSVAAGMQRSESDREHERLELVVRLAALDERFAAGELSDTEYAAERDRGKQRLRELTFAQRLTAASTV